MVGGYNRQSDRRTGRSAQILLRKINRAAGRERGVPSPKAKQPRDGEFEGAPSPLETKATRGVLLRIGRQFGRD